MTVRASGLGRTFPWLPRTGGQLTGSIRALSSARSETLTGGTAYVVEAKLNLRNDATKDPGPFKAMGIPYKK